VSEEKHEERRVWGRSNPCPQCGGVGYLDRIDLVDRVMFEHCVDCGHKYEEHEQDLSLLYRS
jgi:Zn ribbon nucleic-acid-binding protein